MRENKTCPEQGWKQMPVEKLDQILQAELEKEYPNEEVVLPIIDELEEREKDYPVEKSPETIALLAKLKERKMPSKRSAYKLRWIAAVAAVVCIVILALPRTVGAESVFDALFRWTESIFEFFDPAQDESMPQVNKGFATENAGLQQVYDKVTEIGVTESVVPMWVPEGLELTEIKVTPMPNGQKVYAKLESGTDGVILTYWISTEKVNAKFEKEDTTVELCEFADVNHFIIENEDNLSVMWAVDNFQCSIATTLDKDTVYSLIKSIYRRETP